MGSFMLLTWVACIRRILINRSVFLLSRIMQQLERAEAYHSYLSDVSMVYPKVIIYQWVNVHPKK